jgi:hypothetical protein
MPILLCASCGGSIRIFKPTVPHEAEHSVLNVSLEKIDVTRAPGGGQLTMKLHTDPVGSTVPVVFRLSDSETSPCSGGVLAHSVWTESLSMKREVSSFGSQEFVLEFSREGIDKRAMFERGLAVLDLFAVDDDTPAATQCVRLPLVQDTARTEWEDNPSWFFGGRLGVFVPVKTVGGVKGGMLERLRFGPWLGPVRLLAELGLGLVFSSKAESGKPTSMWLFTGGVGASTLLFSLGRIGLVAELGYEVNVPDSRRMDYIPILHGPHLALRISGLPERLGWPGFDDTRPFTADAGLELFTALWWDGSEPGPTAVFGIALSGAR